MSNPYAPKSQLAKKEAPTPARGLKELEVNDVPEGSIEDVLNWVNDDPKKAELAIEAEQSEDGKNRSSLIKTLKKVADDS